MTLLERDPNAPAAWYGNLPVTSRYTYGLAGENVTVRGLPWPQPARTPAGWWPAGFTGTA